MKIMVLKEALLVVLLLLLLESAPAYPYSYNCTQNCGVGKSAKRVDYPFGFSPGCEIQLGCTADSEIAIGEFKVINLTSSSLIVRIPAACNRSVSAALPLFGDFYSPTWTNAFLFQECKGTLSGCLVPSGFVYDRLDPGSCRGGNVSCLSQNKTSNHMLDVVGYELLSRSGCEYLVSGIAAVDPNGNSLELQALELGWWVNGSCELCSLNATCSHVLVRDGVFGFRCSCMDGFVGNGFVRGGGCRQG